MCGVQRRLGNLLICCTPGQKQGWTGFAECLAGAHDRRRKNLGKVCPSAGLLRRVRGGDKIRPTVPTFRS